QPLSLTPPRADLRPTTYPGGEALYRPDRETGIAARMGLRAVDIFGHLAQRRRGPLCGYEIPRAAYPRICLRLRLALGDGLQRLSLQHDAVAKGGTFEGKHFDGFDSLDEMMRFMQQNGLKVILWMTPFVNTESHDREVPGQLARAANHDQGAAGGFFVRSSPGGPSLSVPWWKGRGSPVDFTNLAARDWFTRQLGTVLTETEVITRSGAKESAVGGFKTDDGESGNGPNTYIPSTASYADGRTGREMRNAYALEYHKTVWNVLKERGLLFSRSGFAGTQAFPGHWAGDNEPNFGPNGLPSVIMAGLSAAMSGFAIWGHDVGGYQNNNFSV